MPLLFFLLAQSLPGTAPLNRPADLTFPMLDGMAHYLANAQPTQPPPSPARLRHLLGLNHPPPDAIDAETQIIAPAAPTRCLIAVSGAAPSPTDLILTPALVPESHRESIYRMAYPSGRHLLGFEIAKVLAAADYCTARNLPIHITGNGYGARIAHYATLVDPRIQSATISNPGEPSRYENVWNILPLPVDPRIRTIVAPAQPIREASAQHVAQLTAFCQQLMRNAERTRGEFIKKTPRDQLLAHYVREIIGQIPSDAPLAPETRRIYDTPAYTGYELYLPVTGQVFASGILLIPKNLKPNERRPLVVAQHGLESRPADLIDPADNKSIQTYGRFAARLAERGFIVYAPQNPYIHGDRFRSLQLKANPLGLTLYSFIVAQHKKTLDFLETLPMVDKDRIGFYGLSYGGRTAMLVPPVEPRYKVVICSGNFNEWTWKIASNEAPYSYLFTKEYEMFDFNLANTFGHYELASLIAPRPFMVERGHYDGVGVDEWVSYEYAKVRRLYANLNIPDKTAIEYFKGPHQIWGVGTFEFLHRHLQWP